MKKKELELEEVTPFESRCIIGSCPSIFRTNRGSYIVVGKIIDNDDLGDVLLKKIGEDETAVELPEQLLNGLFNSKAK